MPKIVDPDQLSIGAEDASPEVTIDKVAKTITLNQAGNLTNEGVTLQALYSFLKEEWKNGTVDADLIKLPFPLEAITEVKFDFINGWNFANDASRRLIRDAGWSVRDNTNALTEAWMGFITLGGFVAGTVNAGSGDRAYYQQSTGAAPANAFYAGPANEPVQTVKTGAGAFDLRSVFNAFLREQGKTYASASLAEQGVANIDYTVYKIPLSNAADPKITTADATIADATNTTFNGMSVSYLRGTLFADWVSGTTYAIDDVVRDTTLGTPRWFRRTTAGAGATAPNLDATNWVAYVGERQIGTTWYAFNIIVDANLQLAERAYEFTQYQNRQNADINTGPLKEGGAVTGKTAAQLLRFLGDTLQTARGVYVQDFNSNDTNRIQFFDIGNTARTAPFVAAGSINFNANLQSDPAARYVMFFADGYGTTSAIKVNNAAGSPIEGNISGAASVNFDFDYQNNTQGGRTANTDANVVVVAMGLGVAQFVRVEGTIGRSTGQSFSLVSALERNYANPA